MKKHVPKTQLSVSKKFYTCIIGRVSESLSLIGRGDAVAETMACIDRYMADGTVPPADADTAVALTFALLRAEIDKAVERSRRARSRAAVKSSAPEPVNLPAAVGQTAEADATAGEDCEPEPFIPRNRRERRLYEQEVRRAARRLARKLTRA